MCTLRLCLILLTLLKIFIQPGSGSHNRRHHHGSSVTPLFGFGVGYKKVSTYVPVLTFQTRKKKPHHSNTDVVFVNQPSDGRPSVTISGNDQDRDQSDEIQSSGISSNSNTGTRQGSQNLGSNGNRLNVQYHNLRSDDMDYEPNEILHSNRRSKDHHGQDRFSRSKNLSSSRRRNAIKDGSHRIESNSQEEDMETDSDEESKEMNEYTIGDMKWDWKPRRGNRHVFGFNRFFGNRPRSYF